MVEVSYHPDPHGVLGWEAFDSFHGFNEQVSIPDTLAVLFQDAITSHSMSCTPSQLVVKLSEVYGDLLAEKVPERSVQYALKNINESYFLKTLSYLGRDDLTQDLANKETHELDELI